MLARGVLSDDTSFSLASMQPGTMKSNEHGIDGDAVHGDPDLAAFLKQLVTGEEGAENEDKGIGMNMWDSLEGDGIPSDGILDGVLGRTGQSKDDKGMSSTHDIFIDEETEKALVRGFSEGHGEEVTSTSTSPTRGGKKKSPNETREPYPTCRCLCAFFVRDGI